MSADHHCAALGAQRVLATLNIDIAEIDVVQPLLPADLTSALKRSDRGRGQIRKLEVRHEPGYVPRRVRPEIVRDPCRDIA
jgi:hypothetical protein